MAFPIPSHLPRRTAPPHDVSSAILTKLDDATNKTLNASLAASWVRELNKNIDDTKRRIHDRIYENLPLFEQQEASSKSVQTRLHSLSADVDRLVDKLSNPQTGLAPTLVRALEQHATLRQQTADAHVLYDCLDRLLRFRTDLATLDELIRHGKLSEAVAAFHTMDGLLEQFPPPLMQSDILVDLKAKFRAMRARTEDQLSDAYDRSVLITSDSLVIQPSVKVRQSQTDISFSNILAALSPAALHNHLNVLRRDIMAFYVVRLLEQSFTVTVSDSAVSCSSNAVYDSLVALDNLSTVLTFLSHHLFVALPSPQDTQFPRSLRKPLAQSVLDNLLIPCLPSSFDKLPSYLALLDKAVAFETTFIMGMLGGDPTESVVETWCRGVAGHYERRRRQMILDDARRLITTPYPKSKTFLVDVELQPDVHPPSVVPFQDEMEVDDAWGLEEDTAETSEGLGSGDAVEADGWGFDDEVEDVDMDADGESSSTTNGNGNGNGKMEDPSDAWGWDDAESPSQEDTPWDDDPWANPPVDDEPPPPTIVSPRVANGLVKKDKKRLNGDASPMPSPSVPQKPPEKRPPHLAPPPATPAPHKESYLVSLQMKEILKMIEDVLNEGIHLTASHVFQAGVSSGNLLLHAAPSILDLYRALYPVVFRNVLKASPDAPIRFSNNCIYLSGQVEKLVCPAVHERLGEEQRRLKILGESWFEDTIDQQRQSVDNIIAEGAAGFTFTGDQDRYDECEAALSTALQDIRLVASRWRGLLTKSKYYTAIGSITEAALSRVVDDITALPDIPEVESQRLSELCKILHALEGLFVEDPEQPSFVVAYVPSWLKFSYLSELLEASMADFKYLFEEGALVDFEVDELVRLVRALFADTSLRTETINRLLAGHPVSAI